MQTKNFSLEKIFGTLGRASKAQHQLIIVWRKTNSIKDHGTKGLIATSPG